MNRVKLHTCFLLLLCLTLLTLSCSKNEVKEFGEYEEVSIGWREMAVRGNCMPIELESVSINTTIKVADGRITNLSFLSSTELIFMNSSNELYICDIESGTKRRLTGSFSTSKASDLYQLFNRYNFYQIFIHNRNEILVFWQEGDEEDLTVSVTFINVEGEFIWHSDPQNLTSNYAIQGIFFDGASYLIFNEDDLHIVEVLALANQGEFDKISSFQGAEGLYFKIPGDHIFYLLGLSNGPYYSERGDEGYTGIEIWNENWNTGFGFSIIDASDRFIGIKREYMSEGEFGSLVILERGDEEPVVIDFDRELSLDLYEPLAPWLNNYHCASDGDTVVFSTTHYLLKYSGGEVQIWHDILLDYGDNWEIHTTIGSESNSVEYREMLYITNLFIDHDSSHFIMVLEEAILYGSDEVEILDFGATITSGLHFTPDFQRACMALHDGSIVVLDIEGTPVDQN